jgi:hypothetical protein
VAGLFQSMPTFTEPCHPQRKEKHHERT